MSANDQSAHSPLELISQSRLGGPGLSRSRRRLSALKRRNSSSSSLFFSSRRVMRDFGSSLPRNFSSALPTESFSVMIQASPFVDRCMTSMDPDGPSNKHTISPRRKCEPRNEGDDLSFSSLADLR